MAHTCAPCESNESAKWKCTPTRRTTGRVNTRASWRTALACAAVVLVVSASPIAAADPVQVTSGALDLHLRTGLLTLAGSRGFTFEARLSTLSGVFGPDDCNSDPLHCQPGGTLSLLGHWEGADAGGTATLDGITYTNVGGLNSESSMVLMFNGSLVLPPMAPSATITVPFTFTGMFTHPGGTGPGMQ